MTMSIDDPRFTAYALGERDAELLSPDDVTAIEGLLAESAEARAAAAELTALGERLQTKLRGDAAMALDETQRELILARVEGAGAELEAAPGGEFEVVSPRARRAFGWRPLAAIAATLLLGVTGLFAYRAADRQVAVGQAPFVYSWDGSAFVTKSESVRAGRGQGEVDSLARQSAPTAADSREPKLANEFDAKWDYAKAKERQIPQISGYDPQKGAAVMPGQAKQTSPRNDAAPTSLPADKPSFGFSTLGKPRNQDAPSGYATPALAASSEAASAGQSFFVPIEREAVEIERAVPPAVGLHLRDARPPAESYHPLRENPFTRVADQPLSTLGADVDTASYANVRRFLTQRTLPPADAVRVEELVNYFRYHDPEPTDDAPFGVRIEQARCPWNSAHHLVRIGVQGRRVDERQRPACNLVLLLDVSGSMQDANKLPLVKAGMQMLVPKLTESDRVAIVTYSDSARVALEPTPGHRGDAILAAVEALRAGGSTNGAGGLELAYDLAARSFVTEGVNRVLLCSDGDFNVGITDRDQLVGLIREKAGRGIFLSVLGFGMGNLKDDRLEGLADQGNGFYAYIDQQREAYRVLAQQAVGTLVTIAKDVKLQVEFNPAKVQAYRLIGYENRALAARDFADDTKDAGEIGAGHAVTVLYEIVPAGSAAATVGDEPLEYAPAAEQPAATSEQAAAPASTSPNLLTAKIRYKRPNEEASQALRFPLVGEDRPLAQASSDFRFAAAVAAWGQRLRGSASLSGFGYDQIEQLARPALGDDPRGERAEFLDLVRASAELGGR